MKPVRIQRRRTKGWKMPPNTVCVTRPGRFGNPYSIKGAREAGYRGTDVQLSQWCVDLYHNTIIGNLLDVKVPTVDEIQRNLRGKNLACYCPLVDADGNRFPCHADILLELANKEPT